MTDNIPPEIADEGSAPAPVRISPEVRETLIMALNMSRSFIHKDSITSAIAFVEALP